MLGRASRSQGMDSSSTPAGRRVLLLALLLGAITALFTVLWLGAQERGASGGDAARAAPLANVVVAREPIAAGTRIQATMLEVKRLPVSAVGDTAIDRSELATGKIARLPLEAGEQVLASRLVGAAVEVGSGLAFSVPAGMRAISIPLTEVAGAGGLVVPGDRVDVLLATTLRMLRPPEQRVPNDPNAEQPAVVTVLQNALVLAVGQQHTPPAIDGRDAATLRASTAEAQPGAGSATLAVTPEQAQQIFLAASQGRLGLALRSFGDEAGANVQPDTTIRTAGAR